MEPVNWKIQAEEWQAGQHYHKKPLENFRPWPIRQLSKSGFFFLMKKDKYHVAEKNNSIVRKIQEISFCHNGEALADVLYLVWNTGIL